MNNSGQNQMRKVIVILILLIVLSGSCVEQEESQRVHHSEAHNTSVGLKEVDTPQPSVKLPEELTVLSTPLPPILTTQSPPKELLTEFRLLDIPQYESEYENWCGCAVAQSVLEYYGIKKTQSEICKSMGMSAQSKVLRIRTLHDYLYGQGLDVAYHKHPDFDWSMAQLDLYLSQGYPVIILQRESRLDTQRGHYRIVVLYTADKNGTIKVEHGAIRAYEGRVYFQDPEGGRMTDEWVDKDTMRELWKANSGTVESNQMLVIKGKR